MVKIRHKIVFDISTRHCHFFVSYDDAAIVCDMAHILLLALLLFYGDALYIHHSRPPDIGLSLRGHGGLNMLEIGTWDQAASKVRATDRHRFNGRTQLYPSDDHRERLYRAIADHNNRQVTSGSSMDRSKSEVVPEMSYILDLFVDYVLDQYSSTGRLQFQSTVKALEQVCIYLNSISDQPMDVLQGVYTRLRHSSSSNSSSLLIYSNSKDYYNSHSGYEEHKNKDKTLEHVLRQLKCAQFTAHVKQKDFAFARNVLLDMLKSDEDYPLDLQTVSRFMHMLLQYPPKDNQLSSTQGRSRLDISFPIKVKETLFPLPWAYANVNARRTQQKYSNFVYEIYTELTAEREKTVRVPKSRNKNDNDTDTDKEVKTSYTTSTLRQNARREVSDDIHEFGARAASALNQHDSALKAMSKISKRHRGSKRVQKLSLYLLDMFQYSPEGKIVDAGGDRTANIVTGVPESEESSHQRKKHLLRLCLLQPVELMDANSTLVQSTILHLGTSDSYYGMGLRKCQILSRTNSQATLQPQVSMRVIEFVLFKQAEYSMVMNLMRMTWRHVLADKAVLEVVQTIIRATCLLSGTDTDGDGEDRKSHREDATTGTGGIGGRSKASMRSRHRTDGDQSVLQAIYHGEKSRTFASLLQAIPSLVYNAMECTHRGSPHSINAVIDVINRSLEMLLHTFNIVGLRENGWPLLQTIFEHSKYSQLQATQPPTFPLWAPDRYLLSRALGSNTKTIIHDMLQKVRVEGVLPADSMLATIFDVCTSNQYNSAPISGRKPRQQPSEKYILDLDEHPDVESSLILALWDELSKRDLRYVRQGPALRAALRYGFSKDVTTGLAICEISLKGAIVTGSLAVLNPMSGGNMNRNTNEKDYNGKKDRNGGNTNSGFWSVNSVLRKIFEVLESKTKEKISCGASNMRGDMEVIPIAVLNLLFTRMFSTTSTTHPSFSLDKNTLLQGAKICIGEDFIDTDIPSADSQRPKRISEKFRIASTRSSTNSVHTNMHIVYSRLVAYFESCRAVDNHALETIGATSDSWLKTILRVYAHVGKPAIGLEAFDRVLSVILAESITSLGETMILSEREDGAQSSNTEIITATADASPATDRAKQDDLKLRLRDKLSVKVFALALRMAQETHDPLSASDRDNMMQKSIQYYNKAVDLFGVVNSDLVALNLLEVACGTSGYLSTAFTVIENKITAGRRISKREALLLSQAACNYGETISLQKFWSRMHKEHAYLSYHSTAVYAILDVAIINNDSKALIGWMKYAIDNGAYLPPAHTKDLLLRYTKSDLQCLREMLPGVSELCSRYSDKDDINRWTMDQVKKKQKEKGEAKRWSPGHLIPDIHISTSLPLSVNLLRNISVGLIERSSHTDTYNNNEKALLRHNEDALALLAYVNQELWPYNELLLNLARAKDLKKATEVLSQRRDLIATRDAWYIPPLRNETVKALLGINNKRSKSLSKHLHHLRSLVAESIEEAGRAPPEVFESEFQVPNLGGSKTGLITNTLLSATTKVRVPAQSIEEETWVDLLSTTKQKQQQQSRENSLVTGKESSTSEIQEGEVKSGLLALLTLHKLAQEKKTDETDIDSEVPQNTPSSTPASTYVNPESPEQLRRFEELVSQLGMSTTASSPSISTPPKPRHALRVSGHKKSWKSALRSRMRVDAQAQSTPSSSFEGKKDRIQNDYSVKEVVDPEEIVICNLMRRSLSILQENTMDGSQASRHSTRNKNHDHTNGQIGYNKAKTNRDESSSARGRKRNDMQYSQIKQLLNELYIDRQEQFFRYCSQQEIEELTSSVLLWSRQVVELELPAKMYNILSQTSHSTNGDKDSGSDYHTFLLSSLMHVNRIMHSAKYMKDYSKYVASIYRSVKPSVHQLLLVYDGKAETGLKVIKGVNKGEKEAVVGHVIKFLEMLCYSTFSSDAREENPREDYGGINKDNGVMLSIESQNIENSNMGMGSIGGFAGNDMYRSVSKASPLRDTNLVNDLVERLEMLLTVSKACASEHSNKGDHGRESKHSASPSSAFASDIVYKCLKDPQDRDLAIAVYGVFLQQDVRIEDATCELLAVSILSNPSYQAIAVRLFGVLMSQNYLPSFATVKAFLSHQIRVSCQEEEPDYSVALQILVDASNILKHSGSNEEEVKKYLTNLSQHFGIQVAENGAEIDSMTKSILRSMIPKLDI